VCTGLVTISSADSRLGNVAANVTISPKFCGNIGSLVHAVSLPLAPHGVTPLRESELDALALARAARIFRSTPKPVSRTRTCCRCRRATSSVESCTTRRAATQIMSTNSCLRISSGWLAPHARAVSAGLRARSVERGPGLVRMPAPSGERSLAQAAHRRWHARMGSAGGAAVAQPSSANPSPRSEVTRNPIGLPPLRLG
jgi:hypothetical protein